MHFQFLHSITLYCYRKMVLSPDYCETTQKSRLPNPSGSLTSDEQSQTICSEYHYHFDHLDKESISFDPKSGFRLKYWNEISRQEETFEQIALADKSSFVRFFSSASSNFPTGHRVHLWTACSTKHFRNKLNSRVSAINT